MTTINKLLSMYIMSRRERAIHISSIDRVKAGVSECEDFVIKFNPSIQLDINQRHEVAVDQISMTYSWHNITPKYNNNVIKYSHDKGSTWTTVTFPNGMYSYDDLNNFLQQTMKGNSHIMSVNGKDQYGINIVFVLTTYKVIVEINNNYQLDLRATNFGELIGFDKKIIQSTEEGSRLPNITNSIDSLHINSDIINDSIVGGIASNTLCVIPTGTLNRSYPFVKEPVRALFNQVATTTISSMRVYVTDSLRRPVHLNGIDWHMSLILRSS